MTSSKTLPLILENLSKQECEQFRISAPLEIKSILRQIVEHQAQVALYFEGQNSLVLSELLNYDAPSLFFSLPHTEQDQQKLSHQSQLTLVAWQHNVKIQIPLSTLSSDHLNGSPVLASAFPSLLYRLQKREFFRLNMPADTPLRCNLVGTSTTTQKLQDVTISNISNGGIGLVYSEQQAQLQTGEHYLYQIELPGLGRLSGTIEIKNITPISSPHQKGLFYAGCEFKDLSRQADVLLQRYVTSMQRATRQL